VGFETEGNTKTPPGQKGWSRLLGAFFLRLFSFISDITKACSKASTVSTVQETHPHKTNFCSGDAVNIIPAISGIQPTSDNRRGEDLLSSLTLSGSRN